MLCCPYRPGPWARCGGHAGPRAGVASGSGWLQAGRCATQAFPGTLRPRACNPKRDMAQAQGCILRTGPTAYTRQCQSPQATAPAITRHPNRNGNVCQAIFYLYFNIIVCQDRSCMCGIDPACAGSILHVRDRSCLLLRVETGKA